MRECRAVPASQECPRQRRLLSLAGLVVLFPWAGCDAGSPSPEPSAIEETQQALNGTRHRYATELGVTAWLSDPSVLSTLKSVSTIGDDDSFYSRRSEAHFDNCYWREGRQFVADNRAVAVTKALDWYWTGSSSSRSAFFNALGFVIHATQDLYAHSNWVQTYGSGVLAPFDEMQDPPTTPWPVWYSFTYYNWFDSGPNAGAAHCPVGYRYSHDSYNLDGTGGANNDKALVSAAAATFDQIGRFVNALCAADAANCQAVLYSLGMGAQPSTTPYRWDDYGHTVTPPGGPWGQNGAVMYCPQGTYVGGFRQRVESSGSSDLTGLNAVQFHCYDRSGVLRSTLDPWSGVWGNWGSWSDCGGQNNFVTGGILKVQPSQGSSVDDTSANAAAFWCGNNSALLLSNNDGPNGSWAGWALCGPGEAVCGAQVVVEPPISGDDTALNGINLRCCAL